MNEYYTGIGSRNIPDTYFNLIIAIAEYMAKQGYILRSGGADGSDNAFEIGCDRANGKKEIMDIVKKLNEEGKTIIVVTHDMDLVLNYASKVIVFSNSLLVEETTPLELFNKTDLSEYSLEVPSLIKLATLLKEKGFNIEIDKNLSISNLAKQIKDNIYDNR